MIELVYISILTIFSCLRKETKETEETKEKEDSDELGNINHKRHRRQCGIRREQYPYIQCLSHQGRFETEGVPVGPGGKKLAHQPR